ncbi:MAG: UDP-N-acetylglucosamine 2-epimerase (non-hydrolyzing) [Desulfovibrio sp.]|nr:UDP-N-acetylglucosamine 2-epimerase (non-hydrolyzing) [Desulfovibrio sp.]
MKILSVFGTRPEAIKMAPVIKALADVEGFDSRVCVTAQHREMLDQALEIFEIRPDFDLDLMRENQTLPDIMGKALSGISKIFEQWRPDIALIQGDTITTMAASMAAYFARISVGHVEAGLRTGDKYAPWPEEINRRVTATIADLHFAPTEIAAENLAREGIPRERIHVTGNTVIDALREVKKKIRNDDKIRNEMEARFSFLDPAKKLILVTGHRRENFGDGFENICEAIAELSERADAQIVYPAHLNPHVQEPVNRVLKNRKNIFLMEPLSYLPFVYLMDRSYIILTDSGGVQEEAPALGKPVLVMRESTERPEAVAAGTSRLVGADKKRIVAEANRLLDDPTERESMAKAANPYGEGDAAAKIANILKEEEKRKKDGHK